MRVAAHRIRTGASVRRLGLWALGWKSTSLWVDGHTVRGFKERTDTRRIMVARDPDKTLICWARRIGRIWVASVQTRVSACPHYHQSGYLPARSARLPRATAPHWTIRSQRKRGAPRSSRSFAIRKAQRAYFFFLAGTAFVVRSPEPKTTKGVQLSSAFTRRNSRSTSF
jgi:hypothetical protein